MASLLPLEVRRTNKQTRFLMKSFVILLVMFITLFATSSSSWYFSSHSSSPILNDFLDVDMVTSNGTVATESWRNATTCAVGKVPWEHRCDFVKTHEPCGGNRYLKLQYCVMKKKLQAIYYILMFSYLLLLFYLLGDTAEEYFSPALIKISDYLRLSPNVAGVTLLALGNGAPDLSSIIVGVLSGNTDFGLGAPIGGGTFVTTVVMGAVILLADVKVTRRPFLRDVIFYLVSVCWVFYFFLDNKVYIWESIICLLIYVLYVVVVVVGRAVNQKLKKRRLKRESAAIDEENQQRKKVSKQQKQLERENSDMGAGLLQNESNNTEQVEDFGNLVEEDGEGDSGSDTESDQDWTGNRGWKRQPSFILYDSVNLIDVNQKGADEEAPKVNEELQPDETEEERERRIRMQKRLHKTKSAVFIPKMGIVQRVRDDDKNQALVVREYFDKDGEVEKNEEEILQDKEEEEEELNKSAWKKNVEKFLDIIEWNEKNLLGKIQFVLYEALLMFVRNLTIPRADNEHWNKWFAAAVVVFAPLWILFAIGEQYFIYMIKGKFPVAVIVLLCGLIVSGVVLVTTRRSKPPFYHFLFVIAAFGMSIVWIYIVANQLLEVLESLGAAWNIKKSILAVTVLSWGNSLGDMISDITVARQGFPSMAIGATLGGPMLNLLIGIGLSMTFAPDQLKYRCFALSPDPTVAVSFCFLIISLVCSLIVIPASCFKGYKVYGVFLILLYIANLTLSLLAATYAPVTKAFTWNFGRSCKWAKQ